jgi:hypothetical protein
MKVLDEKQTLSRRSLTGDEMLDHCYHEAGHAVVAIRLGMGLSGKVEVIPKGEGWREFGFQQIWFGRTQVEHNGSAEEMAMFFLAGIAAERHHNPKVQDTRHWAGDQDAYFGLFPVGTHQMTHWIAAEQLVERNWGAVEAVAMALFHAKGFCLAADDVVTIVNQYPPAPESGR